MHFEWNKEEQNFEFSNNYISIKADREVFDWNNSSALFLAPLWYRTNNGLEFGIRKIIILSDNSQNEDQIIFERKVIPHSSLGSRIVKNWNDMATGKFPFNGKPVISPHDNTGSISEILQTQLDEPQTLFSLELSMENPQSEENLKHRFDTIKKGIVIEY
jgi:hypothetical protein